MWSLVASRLHSPMKVFLFGEGTKETKEVMIYGTVKYGLKDERVAEVSSFHFYSNEGCCRGREFGLGDGKD